TSINLLSPLAEDLRYETGISIPVGLSDSPSNELDRDRTIAVFEEPGDRIPVPTFAESFNLTVGEMFSWLTQ
ncbi:hypothetical protein QUB47_34070, partial [Microcoleus sp. AT9_B5]